MTGCGLGPAAGSTWSASPASVAGERRGDGVADTEPIRFPWERAVRDNPAVTDNRLLVLMVLASYTSTAGTARVGVDKLADRTGLGRSTVRDHIRAARQAGLLDVVQRGGRHGERRTTNVYKLTLQPTGVQPESQPPDSSAVDPWCEWPQPPDSSAVEPPPKRRETPSQPPDDHAPTAELSGTLHSPIGVVHSRADASFVARGALDPAGPRVMDTMSKCHTCGSLSTEPKAQRLVEGADGRNHHCPDCT